MPYKSDKQRRFFHTKAAKEKGITPEMVDEFDKESEGEDLPEQVAKKPYVPHPHITRVTSK